MPKYTIISFPFVLYASGAARGMLLIDATSKG
jgi:hypothetical protein